MKKTLVIALSIMACLITVACKKPIEMLDEDDVIFYSSKKTTTCVKEEMDNDGYMNYETIEIVYDDFKILKIKSNMISEMNSTYIDYAISVGESIAQKLNDLDGVKIEYKKIENNKFQIVTEVDYEKLDVDQLKEVLGDFYDENNQVYNIKNTSFKEYKKEFLKEYICE